MSRTCVLTFFGRYRQAPIGGGAGDDHDDLHGEPHESPPSMAWPLIILAVLSVVVGWVGIPFGNLNVFAEWLHFEGAEHGHFVGWIALLSTGLAVAGIGLGWKLYSGAEYGFSVRDPLERFRRTYKVLDNRFYIDHLYLAVFVRPIQYALSKAVYRFDQKVIDGVVNRAGVATVLLGRAARKVDEAGIDGIVNGLARLTDRIGGLLRYGQSGNVQRYAAGLFLGLVVLAAVLFL
jgi:NADH-quinone oxidoreductase subunit L